MAAQLLQLLPKRTLDFSNSSTGALQKIILLERIDISQYIDGMMGVRVHAANLGASNTMLVELYGDGFTENDPTLNFSTLSPLFTGVTVSGSTAPGLQTAGGSVRGKYAQLVATLNKAISGQAASTISVELALRCPDEAPSDV